MSIKELLQAGQLDRAVEAAVAEVKKKPADHNARYLLAELYCVQGDLERADKQLDTLQRQVAEGGVQVILFRQLLRAERARREFYEEKRLPEFLGEPSEALQAAVKGIVAVQEGDLEEGGKLLSQAEQGGDGVTGKCDGEPFQEFRDLDDCSATFFDVLTSTGKYYVVPVNSVREIQFHALKRVRDMVWRGASMNVQGGPDGEVFIPMIYPVTYQESTDEALRLGRATSWTESAAGERDIVRGLGQRTFLVGDEDRAMQTISTLEFASPSSSDAAQQ